jgi:phosphate uptake regulator
VEYRKLQKVGADTLTVSLPAEWVRKRELRKGDQVVLVEEGADLKLLTLAAADERHRPQTSTVVDADQCVGKGFLERVVVGNYILGRETITIVSRKRLTGEHLEEARSVVRRLMGIGIIEETHSRIVLHCSIDPSNHPLQTLILRLYQLGQTMLDESLEALVTSKPSLADEALRREDDSDMMYWLILRLVLTAQMDNRVADQLGIRDPREILQYHLLCSQLETVGDHCAIIAGSVKELIASQARIPEKLRRHYLAQADLIERMYHHALNGLLRLDLTQANEAIVLGRELAERDTEIIRTVVKEVREPREVIPLRVISGRMARIGEYAVSIALMAFNRYLVRSTPLCRPETGEKKR